MKKNIIISFLLVSKLAFAQFYDYRHISSNLGLPSSEVYQVFQDSKGFIWFATDNGVCKFNGYKFETYKVNKGLPNNIVFEIYEDKTGRIWFYSYGAKLSYFLNDSIYPYKNNNKLQEIRNGASLFVKQSLRVNKNNIEFSCRNNGYTKITAEGSISHLDKKYGLIVKNNNIFINNLVESDSLLIKFNNTDLTIYHPIRQAHFHRIAILKDSSLYFSISNTLYKICPNKTVYYCEFEKDIIWLTYANNELWVGTFSGAFSFKNGDINKEPSRNVLTDFSVSSVLVDNEDGYWFATLENGVYYLPNIDIESVSQNNSIIKHPKVNSLFLNENSIFYGSYNGEIGKIHNNKIFFKQIENNTTHHTSIRAIKNNSYNEIFALTFTGFYKVLSVKNSTDFTLNKIIDFGGKTFLIDRKNNTWIVQRQAVIKIDENNNIKALRFHMRRGIQLYSIYNNNEHETIIGTNHGLWHYNQFLDTVKQDSLIGDEYGRVTCIEKDSFNRLWVGTKEKGIFIKNGNEVLNLNIDQGLADNYVTAMVKHKNVMWVGTKSGGLNKITFCKEHIWQNKIQTLTQKQGFLSNEINDITINDDLTIIASNSGINIINNENFEINKSPPRIYIESIKLNKDAVLNKNFFELNYDFNSVEINLIGLSFKQLGTLKYNYRLLSSVNSTNWIQSKDRSINLSYLKPGNYIFQAKCINGNNIESNKFAEVKFLIKPPYWETWWFVSITLIVAILLAFIIYKFKIKAINNRNKNEKDFLIHKNKLQREIDKYRQQALTQQMNPHFIFNSLNSIQLFIYQNNKELSTKYLSKFSKLVRLVLENSQHSLISISQEIEALKLYLELEHLRLKNKLEFKITIDKGLNTLKHGIPPLLVQPFVENAIWHGIIHLNRTGTINIEFNNFNNYIECIIEDDGVGRVKAMEIKDNKYNRHQSLGSEITEKRLELLNNKSTNKMTITYSDLNNDKQEPGTKVVFKIPKMLIN